MDTIESLAGVTPRRFAALARRFGLKAVAPLQRRYLAHLAFTLQPMLAVAPTRREACANVAMLAMATEPELIFVLGHEAGHVVHVHQSYVRTTEQEVEADMWGLEALRAHRLPLDIGVQFLRRFMALYPGINAGGEVDERIRQLDLAIIARPQDYRPRGLDKPTRLS